MPPSNSPRGLLFPHRPTAAIEFTCFWRASESHPCGGTPIGNITACQTELHVRDSMRFWFVFANHPCEGWLSDGIPVIASGSRTITIRRGKTMCNKSTKEFVAGEIAVVATRTFALPADTPSRPFTDSNRTRDGYRPVSLLTPDHESLARHSREEVAASAMSDATNAGG